MLSTEVFHKVPHLIWGIVRGKGVRSVEQFAFFLTTIISLLVVIAQRIALRRFGKELTTIHSEDDAKVNSKLYSSFIQISKICLPTWRTREFFGSFVFVFLFLLNAILRVWMSRVDSHMLATMLGSGSSTRLEAFVRSIVVRCSVSLTRGLCSGAIEWIRPWLISCYRERLARDFQRRFFKQLVYYQSTVLDDRLERADTVIASYCAEFAEHFAELPYYFLLPGLECVTSAYALVEQSGAWSASLVGCIVTISVLVLQRLAPPFGRLHALLLQREDNYRRMLTNTLDNVENIALHGGGPHTLMCLNRTLGRLKYSLNHMALAAGHFFMLETILSSFLTIVANVVAFTAAERGYYRRSVNDMLLQVGYIEGLNCSVKNFIVNFRELSHLTEFSLKMSTFDKTLNSIASGTFINKSSARVSGGFSLESSLNIPSPRVYSPSVRAAHDFSSGVFPLFTMDKITLLSPVDALLIKDLSMVMKSDEDWVITGENGSGKTSIMRMLTGLWFPSSGKLAIDDSVKFLIAPQHTYMAPGCTLYEQLIFPMEATCDPDEEKVACIKQAVELAGASSVIDVAGGYDSPFMGLKAKHADTSFDWTRLSGGQKQRVSLARIFFYKLYAAKPEETIVAILDEATSMLDEFECDVITNMRREGIRMISITHRSVVMQHHSHILHIKKHGQWATRRVEHRLAIGERPISPQPQAEETSPTTTV